MRVAVCFLLLAFHTAYATQQKKPVKFAKPDKRSKALANSQDFSTEPNVNAHDAGPCTGTALTPDPLVSTGTFYQPFSFRQSTKLKAGNQLLLMSHGAVQWFNPEDQKSSVILAKSGERYRGAFVLDNLTLVVLVTPTVSADSEFVLVGAKAGKELRRNEAQGCRDGQDVVRYGEMAYAVCAGTGSINVYDVKHLVLRRRFAPFTQSDHINTIGETCWYTHA
jgi:hypothetical protein